MSFQQFHLWSEFCLSLTWAVRHANSRRMFACLHRYVITFCFKIGFTSCCNIQHVSVDQAAGRFQGKTDGDLPRKYWIPTPDVLFNILWNDPKTQGRYIIFGIYWPLRNVKCMPINTVYDNDHRHQPQSLGPLTQSVSRPLFHGLPTTRLSDILTMWCSRLFCRAQLFFICYGL
jgi:hypothetical protein